MTLSERIEAAEGPSRELDAEIAVAIKHDLPSPMGECAATLRLPRKDDHCEAGTYWLVQRSGMSLRTAPAFTASLDAAMTLAPVGYWAEALIKGAVSRWTIVVGGKRFHGEASTPALALAAAAIRAREGGE